MRTRQFFFMGMVVWLFCAFPQVGNASPPSNADNYQVDNDTTVYSMPNLDVTAALPDAINYYLKNNKYKDWEGERKVVYFTGIVEKDGTITGLVMKKSSGIDYLDKEAIRLLKAARYTPGKYKNKVVRSAFSIPVPFPTPKQ